jgi:hypothetical protein
MISESDKQEMVVEIFSLTGLKLDVDDPVTLAALFYCEKLRMATAEHQMASDTMLKKWEARIDFDVANAVRMLAAAATAERANDKCEYAAMITQARLATHGELPVIKRDIEKFAEGLMRQMRKKASPQAEVGMSLRALLGAISVAAIGGGVVAFFWLCQAGLVDGRRLPAFLNDSAAQEQVDAKGTLKHAR